MKYVKWTLITLLVLIVGGFLHYTLPRHDVVRIVETDIRRIEFGGAMSMFWGSAEPTNANAGNRDVKFISAIRANGSPIVYRNEDTGWGWPPYFKLNSADLQARAADLTSTANDPQWVDVKRYGWRNQLISIYPNAVRLTPVAGPNVTIIPWFNIIFLTLLAAFLIFVWRVWVRFRERRLEPLFEDMGDAIGLGDDDPATDPATDPASDPKPKPQPKRQSIAPGPRGPFARVRSWIAGGSGR